MTPLPGEIHLVDLGMIGKVRPAVIVSREDPDAPRAISICVPITTQNRSSRYEVPLGKLKFLEKLSWANVQGLTSVDHARLLRRLGRVASTQLEEVKDALRFALDL
jgi:mRNA interferase MazF